MCGRYLTPNEQALERVFHVGRHNWQGVETRYNVAPTTQVPVVLSIEGELIGDTARWGLIPTWWKKDTLPTLSFNARSEEAAQKPMWRQSLRAQRCLMPALGWYEWNEHETVPTTRGRSSHQPYFFFDADEPVLTIAGLWSLWRTPAGNDVLSCALLTKEVTDAPELAAIHHRMPVLLRPDEHAAWLAPDTDAGTVQQLIHDSRRNFATRRVSTRVNSVRNEAPDLIEAC
jgi:putative SOS response-associated peptidase YedK